MKFGKYLGRMLRYKWEAYRLPWPEPLRHDPARVMEPLHPGLQQGHW